MPLFGITHGLTVLTICLIAALCIRQGRRGLAWPRAALAFISLSVYPLNQIVLAFMDFSPPLENYIPCHLCDIAAITAGLGLLTRHPLLCELTYCWGLAGTMQGLITPDLAFDFPHPLFWTFFIQHGIIVITALYLPLATGWKPRDGVLLRLIFWNQIYFVVGLSLNSILGTNFGFLSRKPDVGSLLDHLGDWPVYLIWLQFLALTMMFLVLLPFRNSINIWRSRRIRVNPSHE